jgi:hypothetical protein
MVQIINEYRKPTTQEKFGQAFANAGQAAATEIPKYMQDKAEIDYFKEKYGADYSKLGPELRRAAMADRLSRGNAVEAANASIPQDLRDASQATMPSTNEPMTENGEPNLSYQREAIPKKERLPTPQEERLQAANIVKQRTKSGIPTSFQEALNEVQQGTQSKRVHNQQVDIDAAQLRQNQTDYGNLGVQKAIDVGLGNNKDILEMFKKRGEEAALNNVSQADISKDLADQAKSIKHTIYKLSQKKGPDRAFSFNKALGYDKKDETIKQEIRKDIQPLLDLGLYDTARNALYKVGYGKEETEALITDLGEGSRTVLGTMPNIKPIENMSFNTGAPEWANPEYTPQQKELINSSVKDILQKEPSVNFLLLRKAFEEKGVDWRHFKEAINDAVWSGDFKITPEQDKHMTDLEEPPLDKLYKLLEKFNLVGR